MNFEEKLMMWAVAIYRFFLRLFGKQEAAQQPPQQQPQPPQPPQQPAPQPPTPVQPVPLAQAQAAQPAQVVQAQAAPVPPMPEEEEPKLWKIALKSVATLLITVGLLTLIAWLLNKYTAPVVVFGEQNGRGTIAAFALAIYIVLSLKTIGPTDQGAILFLGKPIMDVSSGLVIVPLGICSLVLATRNVLQDELPAEPDKIYRGSKDDPEGNTVPPELQKLGFRPPIRVTFFGSNDESKDAGIPEDDPYNQRLTAEVVPVVRWRIKSLSVFLKKIGSISEARKQLEDTCTQVFNQHLSKVSAALTMLKIADYNNELQKAIEKLIANWGVHLENAEIKALRFSRDLNAAVQNVVIAERNKRAAITTGEGEGGRQKAILEGRGAGMKKMREDAGISTGDAVLAAETARAIAGEGDKSSQRTIIAGSGGFTDLVGTAAAIAKSFSDEKGGKK